MAGITSSTSRFSADEFAYLAGFGSMEKIIVEWIFLKIDCIARQ